MSLLAIIKPSNEQVTFPCHFGALILSVESQRLPLSIWKTQGEHLLPLRSGGGGWVISDVQGSAVFEASCLLR